VSGVLSISYGCDHSRDQAENTRSHQGLVDVLNAEVAREGWPGVKVTRLQSVKGATYVTIVPGVSPLTLDYLRALRKVEPVREPDPETRTDREGQQALAL